jgi:hypothetical protein
MSGMWMVLGGFGGFWSNSAVFDAFSGVEALTAGICDSEMVITGVVDSKTASVVEFLKVLPLLVWLM